MVTLFIMSGFPFSGKTTVALRLVEEFGLQRVSIDDINAELGIGRDPSLPITREQWDRTYAEFHQRLRHILQSGDSVVADTAGFSRQERNVLHEIARDCDATSLVIHVNIPLELAIQRLNDNRVSRTRHDVRDDDFNLVVTQFETPTAPEQVLTYDQHVTWADFASIVSELST